MSRSGRVAYPVAIAVCGPRVELFDSMWLKPSRASRRDRDRADSEPIAIAIAQLGRSRQQDFDGPATNELGRDGI